MSTAYVTPESGQEARPPAAPRFSIDVSQDRPVPFGRLVAVETRKVFDTRAGRWFSVAILGLVVVATVVAVLAFPESEQDYVAMVSMAGGILGYFLPVLMILLVTSEWTQRTGLATFTLEPRRSRVVRAKITAGLLIMVAALVLSAAVAAAGVAASPVNGGEAVWNLDRTVVQSFVLTSLVGVLVGFTLAMLLRNSPAAIVGYFAYTLILPTVVGLLSALVGWFEDVAPWVEFNTAQMPLFTGDFRASGEEWAQIAVTGTVWLVIPFAVGVWRLVRAEVK